MRSTQVKRERERERGSHSRQRPIQLVLPPGLCNLVCETLILVIAAPSCPTPSSTIADMRCSPPSGDPPAAAAAEEAEDPLVAPPRCGLGAL